MDLIPSPTLSPSRICDIVTSHGCWDWTSFKSLKHVSWDKRNDRVKSESTRNRRQSKVLQHANLVIVYGPTDLLDKQQSIKIISFVAVSHGFDRLN